MAYSTAYGNLLYDQKPLEYQPDQLTSQVSQVKNQMFDQAYRNIESMKSNVLNMRLLNKEAQSKVDTYNKQISTFFSDKKLAQMDLADFDIAAQMGDIFSGIGNDSEIRLHKQKTDEILKVKNYWDEAAKNPAKTGYSKENHDVWLNENLVEYMNKSSKDGLEVQSGTYMPYYDYMKDIKNLMGTTLKKLDGTKFEIIDPKNPGVKETVDVRYLTADKINTLLKAGLPAMAITQLQTEGKANAYRALANLDQTGQNKFIADLHRTIESQAKQNSNLLQKQLDETKGKLSVAKPEDAVNLENEKTRLEAEVKNNEFTQTVGDFQKMDKKQLAQIYGNLSSQNKLQNLAQGFQQRIESRTSALNAPYWRAVDNNFRTAQFNYNVAKDQRAFDYNVAKDERDFELETVKANAAIDKASGKTTSIYGDAVPGQPLGSTLTPEQVANKPIELDNELKATSNIPDIKSITPEDAKNIYNNPNHPLAFLRGIVEKRVGFDGVSDYSFGKAAQEASNLLSSGKFDDIRNEAQLNRDKRQQLKDETWNQTAQGLATQGYPEYVDVESNPQTKKNIENRLATDRNFLKEFTRQWGYNIAAKEGTAKLNRFYINTKSEDVKHKVLGQTFYDESGNAVPISNESIDWETVQAGGTEMTLNKVTKKDGEEVVQTLKATNPFEQQNPEQEYFLRDKGRVKYYNGYKINFVLNNRAIDYQISKGDNVIYETSEGKPPIQGDDLESAYKFVTNGITRAIQEKQPGFSN